MDPTIFTRVIVGIITVILLPICKKQAYSRMSGMLLWCLGVTPFTLLEGYEHFIEFNAQPGGVLVYNHPTFLEPLILMKEFKRTFRFVLKEKYTTFPVTAHCAKTINRIAVNAGGTTRAITAAIQSRKAFDDVIAIAPVTSSHSEQSTLLPFKTGAFVHDAPILPVVIKYDKFEPWQNNDSFLLTIFKRIFGNHISYKLCILPSMKKSRDEPVEAFTNRVKTAMEEALSNIDAVNTVEQQNYKGSKLLLLSSLCFGLIGVAHIMNHVTLVNKSYGIGMIIVAVTSIWYHTTGHAIARAIDIAMNLTMGICFSFMNILKRKWGQIACAVYAVYQYHHLHVTGDICDFNHFVHVHIPVITGFMLRLIT